TPEVRESLQDIIKETDQFDSWIRELLTFSQGSADTKYNVSIPEVLDETVQHYSSQLKQNRIELKINGDQDDCEVIAEPHLLRQVFNSLVANSIEAMPNGGLLKISSSTSNGMVTVELSDTGVGISEQDIDNILSPLVSHKPGGLGLGLTLAKRSIEQFGGKLELNSIVGTGTMATITLPGAA
ncbi:MAG: ATP-binding protein, partial [Gammaproteobacteria bacterium]|nr:ATP-binding protein [Gammaproteobacteria bacterium]